MSESFRPFAGARVAVVGGGFSGATLAIALSGGRGQRGLHALLRRAMAPGAAR